jgi:hypothetical protein
VLTQLSIGEAIVTVMNEKGAPSPVAWTRVRAPQGSMEPTPADQVEATVAASPLLAKYGTPVNPPSATEQLAGAKPAATTAEKAEEYADWATKIKQRSRRPRAPASRRQSPMERAAGEAGRTLAREFIKNLFRRRR